MQGDHHTSTGRCSNTHAPDLQTHSEIQSNTRHQHHQRDRQTVSERLYQHPSPTARHPDLSPAVSLFARKAIQAKMFDDSLDGIEQLALGADKPHGYRLLSTLGRRLALTNFSGSDPATSVAHRHLAGQTASLGNTSVPGWQEARP